MKPRQIRRYGWRPSLPDKRDILYAFPPPEILPLIVDLRSVCPPVYNQGQTNGCTGNAIAGAYEYDLMKQGKPDFMPSRSFIYYGERVIEGTTESDSGAMIRDGLGVLNNDGVCTEYIWPFNVDEITVKPSEAAYQDALLNKITLYQRLNSQNIIALKDCLSKNIPFVFGFTVYDSFESDEVANTGIVPMPLSTESVLGGHAVLCVGYNDHLQRFIVRNSWGEDWGQKGYFTMPYEYLTNANLASDFWCINAV